MADIAMCTNSNCPSRDSCYRFIATPNALRQSYSDYTPVGDRCSIYIKCHSKSEMKRLDSITKLKD